MLAANTKQRDGKYFIQGYRNAQKSIAIRMEQAEISA